jgi:hypothetical protein
MSTNEGEITISPEGTPKSPTKVLYFLIIVAFIGLLSSSIISGGMSQDCEEISNREPEDRLPYEGYGCGYIEMIELCCVILPLILAFILFFPIIVPHNEEE